MTYKNQWLGLPAIVLIAAACGMTACSKSSNNAPSPDDGGTSTGGKGSNAGTGGKSGTGGKGGTGGTGTGGKGGTGGSTGTGGTGGAKSDEDAGGGTGGGTSSAGCDTKDASKHCYVCDAPTTDDQFLNRCTGATCTAYDNKKLTKLVDGKIPPLPN
jgi:hypothetical protein